MCGLFLPPFKNESRKQLALSLIQREGRAAMQHYILSGDATTYQDLSEQL
mgnify:CR=1 FL=1